MAVSWDDSPLRMEYESLILKNGKTCGEFFLKRSLLLLLFGAPRPFGTRGSGLMAAWWYALMELTSVMLPLWSPWPCGFFLDVDLRLGLDASERCCFFWWFFRDCLRVCFFWRICVFQNLHGSSFSEFTKCLGSGFGLRKERSHLTVDLLRNFSVLFSADLPTCYIISRTSKSCPFSLRTNLLWNCSPKNSWRGRDEERKCLQNPSFDEISKQYPNWVLVVALFKSVYSELAGLQRACAKIIPFFNRDRCCRVEVYKDPNYIPALAWLEAALFALFPQLQKGAIRSADIFWGERDQKYVGLLSCSKSPLKNESEMEGKNLLMKIINFVFQWPYRMSLCC